MNDSMRILFIGVLICGCDSVENPSNRNIEKSVLGKWATKPPSIETDEGFQTKFGIYPDGRMSFEKRTFDWNGATGSWTLKSELKSSPNSEYVIEKNYLIMKIKSLEDENRYSRLSPKYEIDPSGVLIIKDGLSYEGSNKGLIGIWTSDFVRLETGEKVIDTFSVSRDSILGWRYGSGIKVSVSDSSIFRNASDIPYLNYEILNGRLFVTLPTNGVEYHRYQ